MLKLKLKCFIHCRWNDIICYADIKMENEDFTSTIKDSDYWGLTASFAF
jgi:hypothetical protein